MNYRRMGRTGLKVSEISLGIASYGGAIPENEAVACIHRAFDLGINLFDTADAYSGGLSERALGAAIRDLPREQLIIASKCWFPVWEGPLGRGLSRKHIIEAFDASLTRMRISHIDLYQAHWPDSETPIDETLEAMDLLYRHGKALYIGCSNFSAVQLSEANHLAERRGLARFDCVQPNYCMLNRQIEHDLLPFCGRHGIGVIVYGPLAQGVLTGKYNSGKVSSGTRGSSSPASWRRKYLNPATLKVLKALGRFATNKKKTMSQIALAWILRRPEVTSCIISASRPEQIEQNARASGLKLAAKELEQLNGLLPDAPITY